MKKLFTILILLCLTATTANAEWERKTNLPAIYIKTQYGQSISSKTEYIYWTIHYTDE